MVEYSSHPYPECWIPVNFQATTENSSLSALLDFILKKKKKKNLSLYLSLLPLLACTYLNNDWDLVLRALPLSDCLFMMNRFMYSPNCKSLWIKASAKWLNVNVNVNVLRPTENEKLRFSSLIWLGTILSFQRNNPGNLLAYHECSRRSDMTQRLKVVPARQLVWYTWGLLSGAASYHCACCTRCNYRRVKL